MYGACSSFEFDKTREWCGGERFFEKKTRKDDYLKIVYLVVNGFPSFADI